MQNYGQQPGYQRPGSAASFAGQQAGPPPPPPPGYGGYQSAAPQNQSQWAPPAPNPPPNQQWNQPQHQAAGGYNPGTYGVMGGQQPSQGYPPQQQDQPPPPPPKPYGFAGAVQNQQQNQAWQQSQHNTAQTPQQQGGYPVQGGAPNQQQQQQQTYNNAAPPPPSATPGGSYFPPAQGGRPGSVYGANQVSSYSNTPSTGPQQPSPVMSPNEQQPAYVPPSLTGQGVQAYMPSNTNPMPGVYVPPPPDVPAWQQAQHAPLQGGIKKFRYTKPTVDPSFYAQGYQGVQHMQPQQPQPQAYAQSPVATQHPQQPFGPPNQYVQHGNMPPQPPPPVHGQYAPQQPQNNQIPQPNQPQQQPYGQTVQQHDQHHIPQQYQQPHDPNVQVQQFHQQQPDRPGYGASNMSKPYQDYNEQRPHLTGASNMSKPHNDYDGPRPGASNMSKPYNDNQWQPPQPGDPNYHGQGASNVSKPYNDNQWQPPAPADTQQPQWQPGHHHNQSSQISLGGHNFDSPAGQNIEAPRPLTRTDTGASNFFNQASPQSQPVSPINNRHSMSFGSGHQVGVGRAGSVSSIALANLHAQREGNKTSSPKPPPPKLPTPPPPRDDKSKFSVLAAGGPSDWEHLGGDAEIDDEEIYAKKPQIQQLDSTEIPARQPELPPGPSPPSTHGWPSPATQPTQMGGSGRKDTYQPTPPPVVAHLAERPPSQPQQSFVMGDAAPAPLSISPKPMRGSRPSSTRQSFEMDDGAWAPPKQGTPVQLQSQHQAPSSQQGFVMDDGGWAAQVRQQTPSQQPQQPPPTTTTFTMGDTTWGASQTTPTQETSAWAPQSDPQQAPELKAKEEALEKLRAELEKEKADLEAALEKHKAEIEAMKAKATDEKTILQEQIEAMKTAASTAKASADAGTKEKDLTIERMKEDVEGKEHNIEERNATIADLRRQLEAEKSKEPVKVTPVPGDLIPELDPWYAGSLQRYIVMLRSEANEPVVEDKIKTFRAFLKTESEIRGIPFYHAPAVVETKQAPAPVPASVPAPGASNMSKPFERRQDLNVQVPERPQESPEDEDYEYSPGGRPLLRPKATMPSNENPPIQQFGASTQSTTILTPTSSVDEDSNRTPVQSPPEEQPQQMYKAYVPPALFSTESKPLPLPHRQSVSDVQVPAPLGPIAPKSLDQRTVIPPATGKHHDEIFFGAPGTESTKSTSRPTTSGSTVPDVSVPVPLVFSSNRSAATVPLSRKDPSEALAELLPSEIAPAASNHFIEDIKAKLKPLEQSSINLEDLTKQWDKTATVARKQKAEARRKRQEDNEEYNTDAFDNHEINYVELKAMEDDFKQQELELKAQEDGEEYASYVAAVFDPAYNAVQADIQALMALYTETSHLLHDSVSGTQSLDPTNGAPTTQACLELLQQIHDHVLARQESVVQAVAERDKRYRKTQLAPLFAAGNREKKLNMEKHFETAEKAAVVRAKQDKAARAGEIVQVAEHAVVGAVGDEQREIDDIVAAIKDAEDGTLEPETIALAQSTLTHLKSSSKSLLRLFTALEISHSAAVLDAEIASASPSEVVALEAKKLANEKQYKEELDRKLEVVEGGGGEVEKLVAGKGKKGWEEVEREKRLKAALEEAKRRNGDV